MEIKGKRQKTLTKGNKKKRTGFRPRYAQFPIQTFKITLDQQTLNVNAKR